MKRSNLTKSLVFILLIVFITSCTPGSKNFVEQTAGFWIGLWHGFISFFTFIISLFKDDVGIYEINNNGGWYNFGFILGVSFFFSGGAKGSCSMRK